MDVSDSHEINIHKLCGKSVVFQCVFFVVSAAAVKSNHLIHNGVGCVLTQKILPMDINQQMHSPLI